MSKARQRQKAERRWFRELVAQGIGHDAMGSPHTERVQGDGRGMFEQRMAGYRVGPYAPKGKRAEKDDE